MDQHHEDCCAGTSLPGQIVQTACTWDGKSGKPWAKNHGGIPGRGTSSGRGAFFPKRERVRGSMHLASRVCMEDIPETSTDPLPDPQTTPA